MKKILLTAMILITGAICKIHAQAHIYLASWGSKNIIRVNQDGSDPDTIITNHNTPRGIELDIVNGRLYLAEGTSNKIYSANLDGTDFGTIANASNPVDLKLDLTNQIIYFSDPGDGKIKKSKF